MRLFSAVLKIEKYRTDTQNQLLPGSSEILFGAKKNEKNEKNLQNAFEGSRIFGETPDYMHATFPISTRQIRSFHEDGFAVLPNFLTPEMCEKLASRAADLVDELRGEWDASVFSTNEQTRTSNDYFMESGGKIRVFMEAGNEAHTTGHRVNKIGHALHDLDPVFRAFPRSRDLQTIAHSIGLEKPGLVQSMYIFKQPKIGGEVSIHQDSTFLYTDPLSVVGFWFAIQDATLENGCLWALPGGHKEGLKTKFIRDGKGGTTFEILDKNPLPETGYVPLEVKAGTLVLLHGSLPHYSEANRSEKPRQAYTIHVIDQQADYPADNWLQRPADMPLRGWG